jgi:hypothetical protein
MAIHCNLYYSGLVPATFRVVLLTSLFVVACSKPTAVEQVNTVEAPAAQGADSIVRTIAVLPPGAGSIAVSHDGLKVAAAVPVQAVTLPTDTDSREHWRVNVNGQESALTYRSIGTIIFNGDGTRVAYEAVGEGEEQLVVVDEDEGQVYAGTIGSSQFSPDGKTHGFVVRRPFEAFAVINREKNESFSEVSDLLFRADGSAVYAGCHGDTHDWLARNARRCVIQSGKAAWPKAYSVIRSLTLDPSGKTLAYVAEKKCKDWTLSTDRKRLEAEVLQKAYDTWASECQRLQRPVVVIGDKESAAYDDVKDIALRSGGTASAFTARTQSGWVLVRDGKMSKPYRFALSPSFMGDDQVAYLACSGKGLPGSCDGSSMFVVTGETTGRPYEHIAPDSLRTSAKAVAYVACRFPARGDGFCPKGQQFVVQDDIEGAPFDEVFVDSLRFSEDGMKLFYAARTGREVLWVEQVVE